MPRTKEERDALRAELEREEEEEAKAAAGGGRRESVDVMIDLSDENAVERALKFGFLKAADVAGGDDDDDQGDDDDGGGDKKKAPAPRRKGYFKEGD